MHTATIADPVSNLLDRLTAAGFEPQPVGTNQWESRCPAHQGSRRNLAISRGENGKAILHCHHEPGCSNIDILRVLGLELHDLRPGNATNGHPVFTPPSPTPEQPKSKPEKPGFRLLAAIQDWYQNRPDILKVTYWVYRSADGEEIMAVFRLDTKDDKTYRPYHKTPAKTWKSGDPRGKLPLYHLPDLAAAKQVIVCEGEKDVEAVRRLRLGAAGYTATTAAHGAKSPHKTDWSPLAGKDVVLIPDCDAPGTSYATHVGLLLGDLEPPPKVRVLDLRTIWHAPTPPPEGAGMHDWAESIGRGHTLSQFDQAVATAPQWTPPPSTVQAATNSGDQPTFLLTELGNSHRLLHHYGSELRYCYVWGEWLVWDGRRWATDQHGKALDLSSQSALRIVEDMARATSKDERKKIKEWSMSSQGRRRIEASLVLAAPQGKTPVQPSALDADPWLFNCRNGILDLRTGTLRPHSRDDLLTKLCPWEYHPEAECPLWEETLRKFFARADDADRDDLISYVRRICGYALTGVIREHVLPVAFGTGSNGKSTILNAVLEAFGNDYAMKAPPDLLMNRQHEAHPTERADLCGKRLVVAIETEEGRRINESLVKELTGGDPIRARRMREDFWQFLPTHTLVLATNHKPVIRGTDKGIWRRLKLIPFIVSLNEDQADKSFPERLRAEMPGILAWCVRGCLEWQEIGLEPPPEVLDATKEYRSDQDKLGAFLEEHTVTNREFRVRAGELYDRYKLWAEATGEHQLSLTAFGNSITERGFQKVKSASVFYLGLGLREGVVTPLNFELPNL